MGHDNIGTLDRHDTPERPAPAEAERRIGDLQPVRQAIYLHPLIAVFCFVPVS